MDDDVDADDVGIDECVDGGVDDGVDDGWEVNGKFGVRVLGAPNPTPLQQQSQFQRMIIMIIMMLIVMMMIIMILVVMIIMIMMIMLTMIRFPIKHHCHNNLYFKE